MELLITFVLVTFLVISVGNLLKLKAKTIAVLTIIIDIILIVIIVLTVDLQPVITWIETCIRNVVEALTGGFGSDN